MAIWIGKYADFVHLCMSFSNVPGSYAGKEGKREKKMLLLLLNKIQNLV